MADEYIEFVREWLAGRESKTQEELRKNANAAHRVDCSGSHFLMFARNASKSALYNCPDAAAHWVKMYEELTNGQN